MSIQGIQGMTQDDLADELQRGGRFVVFSYTVSILIMTFKQSSSIHFVRGNESRVLKGLPCTLVTFIFGWWGFPWGPIYSIWSLCENLGGGKDVTREVIGVLNAAEPAPPAVVDAEMV